MSEEKKESILVVEDSINNRTVLVHILKKLGYGVIEAENGKAAWSLLQKESKDKRIVAIFSDLMMPEKDGLELLKFVRNSQEFQYMPFVMTTVATNKEYIFQAKELNIDGYILKPVTLEKMLSKLKELFPRKKFATKY